MELALSRKKLERLILLSFIWLTLVCMVCYQWVDQPLALFMASLKHGYLSFSNFDFADALTNIAYFITLFVMGFFVIARFLKFKDHRVELCGVLSLGMVTAFFIKTQLQFLFGRIAPRYGSFEQLNFVRKKMLYGFHFMQMGSFPSGHMLIFTCILMLLSFYYPKILKYCCFLLCILALLLVYDNYHFLSDVIAGTYLGALLALILKYLLKIQSAHPQD